MLKIGIIGGGNMGEAFIKGLYRREKLFVCEANPERERYLRKVYKKITIENIENVIAGADIVIIAVKPQDLEAAFSWMRSDFSLKDKLFISIAAGLTTKFLEEKIGSKIRKARIIRSMPNMPALIGEGITGICKGQYATKEDLKIAEQILKSVGQTMIIDESMMDALTAVSGSGPAYLFYFVEMWMLAAKELGFNEVQAKELVYKTLIGSAHLLEKSGLDAASLRFKVTSKGGTTAAALEVLKKKKFVGIISQALKAAQKRAAELAL